MLLGGLILALIIIASSGKAEFIAEWNEEG